MPSSGLTGSRIRERRLTAGIKQSALARTVGISAAYLNLIEHNRRGIGGKLLSDIAEALQADATALAEGAEAGLVAALRVAAATTTANAEIERTEEFAGRFPGWARVVADQAQQIEALEQNIETLRDRVAHDPNLAASLHDVLSMVTAINATASILVDTDQIEDEWRDRFHRNIHEDGQRLGQSAQALVTYLDTISETEGKAGSPHDEVEHWLLSRDYHIAELERSVAPSPAAMMLRAPEISSKSGADIAMRYFEQYLEDAGRMPKAAFVKAANEAGLDPTRLAQQFNVDIAAVLRRIATLETPNGAGRIGFVRCDGSGAVTFRKPIEGFVLPRLGATCPLWPLYQALSKPLTPLRNVIELSGHDPIRYLTYAIAHPVGVGAFDGPVILQSCMLIIPADRVRLPDIPALKVGTNCQTCPKTECPARREPSLL